MTVKLGSIENAVAVLLRDIDDRFRVYANTVIESFTAPCFFVVTRLTGFETKSKNSVKLTVDCAVTFFPALDADQRVRDEAQALKLMSILPWKLHPCLAVSDRHLIVSGGSFSYGGENNDLLRYSFQLEYYDEGAPEDAAISEERLKILEMKMRTSVSTTGKEPNGAPHEPLKQKKENDNNAITELEH